MCVLIQLFMAITSTGSAELIAVSSLVTYDIYLPYIRPQAKSEELLKVGKYFIVAFGCFMGVLGVVLKVAGLSLGWVYLAMGNLIGSAVFPIAAILMWRKTNKRACQVAAVSGLVGAVIDDEPVRYTDPDELDEEKLNQTYRFALKYGLGTTLTLVLIWPIPMFFSGYVFTKGFWIGWVVVCFIWGILAGLAIVLLPLVESGKGFSKATLGIVRTMSTAFHMDTNRPVKA